MYLAIKDFGKDLSQIIVNEKDQLKKWRIVEEFLNSQNIQALHMESRYSKLGLNLADIPDFILTKYRLTIHKNGIDTLYTQEDFERWDREFEELFNIIKKYDEIEDLSFHLP